MMQAIGAAGDATVIARPPWLEPGIIMKLLDAGASASSARWSTRPPMPRRWCAPATTRPRPAQRRPDPGDDGLRAAYIQDANRGGDHARHDRDQAGARECRGDRADPGLGALCIGPWDLAQSLGHPIQMDPTGTEVMAAIDRILRWRQGGRDQGRHALHDARLCESRWRRKGFDFVTLGNDVRMLVLAVFAGTRRVGPASVLGQRCPGSR